ncbi:MAG TPA: nucleoside kinase [Anaerolineales bacterium]|nr:nucleoside kinase [Anaerolineales bacterium]
MAEIKLTALRDTIQIHLPDGTTIEGPRGALAGDLLAPIENESAPTMGALVDGRLRELTYPITMDARVSPVTMADEDGMRIYRRTLTFLLETAFDELLPGARMEIDHSVAAGGYFCQVYDDGELDEAKLAKIETRMRELVEADLPISKRSVPLAEAIALFEARGYHDKVRLLNHRSKNYLILYSIGDTSDYHHGYMLPSTRFVRWFSLEKVEGGFTLRFPRRGSPTRLSPPHEFPKMLAIFRGYGDLLEKLGIESVGALNDAILNGRIREIVLVSEALHERRIAETAAMIAARVDEIKVILISGPSSSGKTTSSRRLTVQLLAQGISPYPLEMDNYFVDRERTPKDPRGEFDFESLYALDLARLNDDLGRIVRGQTVQLPRFDFRLGKSVPGETVRLERGQIVIMEGIHGLNPDLLTGFPTERTFRMYISALTQLNLDRHNRVSTTDTRLIRRIVRDERERGYSAQDTIRRWDSVTRGEKRNIFPFQEQADYIFNSALVYELGALKPFAEPLLRQVPYGCPEHVEAKRLISLLEWVLPIDLELVPDNSLLREFLGGSILKNLRAWGH